MTKAFIAIDTGGTRTTIEISVPGTGLKPQRFEVAESISGMLAPTEYPATIHKIFAPIEEHLQKHCIAGMPFYVFIGSAGFAASSRSHFEELLLKTIPSLLGGNIKVAGVTNDATSLLWGYEADAAIVAGTGSNVLVRDATGQVFQAGGHEWVATDHGSGFWIGLKATRQVASDLENDEDTVLLSHFGEAYGINPGDKKAVIEKFRSLAKPQLSQKTNIAHFAQAACVAAELGDEKAQNIVKAEAEKLADSVANLIIKHLDTAGLNRGLKIVQCGSLLANSHYQSVFEPHLKMRLTETPSGMHEISRIKTKTGVEAIMNLAKRLPGNLDDLLQAQPGLRPIITRF